jgi:hypothetical protein
MPRDAAIVRFRGILGAAEPIDSFAHSAVNPWIIPGQAKFVVACFCFCGGWELPLASHF